MKTIILLLFNSLISFAQDIKIDSIHYKSNLLSYCINNDTLITKKSDVIFEFYHNKIVVNLNNQSKILYKQTQFKETYLSNHKTKYVQCKDNGGFYCAFYIGLDEKTNLYFIVISYSNVDFLYTCNITEEEITKFPDTLPGHYVDESLKYTNEEVINFLSKFGDPKILMQIIWNDLLF